MPLGKELLPWGVLAFAKPSSHLAAMDPQLPRPNAGQCLCHPAVRIGA